MSVSRTKNLIKKQFGYDFKDLNLLAMAITHSSKSELNYEKMEFLGDSVLSLVIAEILFKELEEAKEGGLTKKKSMVVDNRNLANTTKALGLSTVMLVGKNQKISKSMLADLFESLLGAIYIDSNNNYKLLKKIIKNIYRVHWKDIHFADNKSLLQNKINSMNPAKTLSYKIEEKKEGQFIIGVYLDGKLKTRGNGNTKKEAEQRAAGNLLRKLSNKLSKKPN